MEPELREVEALEPKVESELGKVETAVRKVTRALDIRKYHLESGT